LPRHFFVHQANFHHLHRVQYYYGSVTPHTWRVVEDLLQLSMHPYTQIRKLAQETFRKLIARYRLPTTKLAQRILSIWSDSRLSEAQVLGSGFLLQVDVLLYRIFDNWKLFRDLMVAICKSHQHQSVKLQNAILDFLYIVEERCYLTPIDPNDQTYKEIVELISQQAPALSWCYQERLLHYLSILLHAGKNLPPSHKLCKYLLACVKSDITAIRYGAVICLQQLLHNIKIARPRTIIQNKLFIDKLDLEVLHKGSGPQIIPQTSSEWETTPFCDWCYFGWNGKLPWHKIYEPLSEELHQIRMKVQAAHYDSYEEYLSQSQKLHLQPNQEAYLCRKLLSEQFSSMAFWNEFTANSGNDERTSDMTEVYTKFFQLYVTLNFY
jgi:hypothetical protein